MINSPSLTELKISLRKVRIQKRNSWLVSLACIGCLIFLAYLQNFIPEEWSNTKINKIVRYSVALLLIINVSYTISKMFNILCPFCGRRFYINKFSQVKEFAKKCSHCGLKLNGSNIDELLMGQSKRRAEYVEKLNVSKRWPDKSINGGQGPGHGSD